MTAKKEPLKLMPLDEFKKFVQAITHVPKTGLDADSTTKKREADKKGR